MAAFTFKYDLVKFKAKIKAMTQIKPNVMPQAYKFFVAHTPIKTGNARSKTTFNNNEINANYPYAGGLDAGASRQAPIGMTQPTKEEIKRLALAWIKQNGTK